MYISYFGETVPVWTVGKKKGEGRFCRVLDTKTLSTEPFHFCGDREEQQTWRHSQPCKRARGQTFDTVRWITSVSLNHAIHSHSSGLFISRPVQNYLLVLSTISTFELVVKKFCDKKKINVLEVFFSEVFSCFAVNTLFNYNVNIFQVVMLPFLSTDAKPRSGFNYFF